MVFNIILVIFVILIIIFYNNEYFETKKKCYSFQHNKNILVTLNSYNYVTQVKQQLLFNIDRLLNDLNIKYVLAHGNLIEYLRGKKIYHDDDIDIRVDLNDFSKWESYCKKLNNLNDYKYNLRYDNRIFNINKQTYNGIQVRLIKFKNNNNIKEYDMDIHCDLVFNIVGNKFWVDYNLDYNKRLRVKYLDVDTYVPNKKNIEYLLNKEYGKYYIKPNYRLYKLYNENQCQ